MKVYRCCSWDETMSYKNNKKYSSVSIMGKGTNTFMYELDKDYIHFFLYPENCVYCLYDKQFSISSIIVCDIPDDILERNFGYGYYSEIYEGRYIPTPEFAIPIEEFKIDYIKKIISPPTKVRSELDEDKFKEYLKMLPEEYAPDYCFGFNDGYDKYSVLNMPNNYVFTKKKNI